MIRVIAMTQFAFLTLGVVSLKIMIQANTDASESAYLAFLNTISLWLFAIPIGWVFFATLCSKINKAPLTLKVAQVTGVIIAVACFLFLASASMLAG